MNKFFTLLLMAAGFVACRDNAIVERMSSEMPGLVETSNNLAMVKIEGVFSLAGIDTTFTGGYSGWAPNPESDILRTMKKVYNDLYGKEPAVMAIHAGLECGILSGVYPIGTWFHAVLPL